MTGSAIRTLLFMFAPLFKGGIFYIETGRPETGYRKKERNMTQKSYPETAYILSGVF